MGGKGCSSGRAVDPVRVHDGVADRERDRGSCKMNTATKAPYDGARIVHDLQSNDEIIHRVLLVRLFPVVAVSEAVVSLHHLLCVVCTRNTMHPGKRLRIGTVISPRGESMFALL